MSAPSFSSFPPSFGSFPDSEGESKPVDAGRSFKGHAAYKRSKNKRYREKEEDEEAHRSSKRRRRSQQHDRRDTKPSDYNDHSDDNDKRPNKAAGMRQPAYEAAGEPGLYIVDKRGDNMNIVYGGLHSGDVPRYKRSGYGSILGLPLSLKIVAQKSRGGTLEVSVNGRRHPPRYIESRSYAALISTKPRLLSLSFSKPTEKQQDQNEACHPEFIPLPGRGDRVTEESLPTHRSLEIKDGSHSETGSDSNYSDEDLVGSDVDEGISRSAEQQAVAELEILLQKTPTSIPLWLSLIDHTLNTIPLSNKLSMTKARSEIRLSILDRALRTHEEMKASVTLRIMWLNAGASVWDGRKQENEWEMALRELGREDISSNSMWNEWFRWRVSNAGRHSRGQANLESILNDAKRLVENLRGELAKVKALWRIAVVLKDAGFLERAMALFQAQVELSFCCPKALSGSSLSARLDALEEFWEAEVPRAGESHAVGWDTWNSKAMSKNAISEIIDGSTSKSPRMNSNESSDPYIRWAMNEGTHAKDSRTPKRTTDVVEDPFAIVLFSDIRPLLIDIQVAEARHGLRLAWLNFLGLHIPGLAGYLSQDDCHHDDVWTHSHLTRTSYMRRLFPHDAQHSDQAWHVVAGAVIAKESTYGHAFGCVKEWSKGVLSPIETIDSLGIWHKDDVDGVDKILVRNVFEQLRQRSESCNPDDEEWDLLAVAFEAAINLKSALKLSQTLLSTNRNSLVRWGVHARLQRIRHKVDEARKIYETVFANADSTLRGAAQLWWDRAEMEWLRGDDDRAMVVIQLSTGSGNADNPMAILRSKRILDDRIHNSFYWKDREAWACLRALLEVLVGDTRAIEEGMHVFQRYIDESNVQGAQKESAWTQMLMLQWKHTVLLKRQARRGQLRVVVSEVLQRLQEQGIMNTVILGIFLEGEKGESVWGRVKTLLSDPKGNSKRSVAQRIWQIWLASWESWKWEEEKERVRASLGIAVNEERTKASPVLWRAYIEFEIYCGELKRAKGLLFRAVADCPLVKELYLLAFGPLRSVFTATELDAWSETMAERGLRLFCGLDEFTEHRQIPQRNSEDSETEDAGELELEAAANEYRRLAPF